MKIEFHHVFLLKQRPHAELLTWIYQHKTLLNSVLLSAKFFKIVVGFKFYAVIEFNFTNLKFQSWKVPIELIHLARTKDLWSPISAISLIPHNRHHSLIVLFPQCDHPPAIAHVESLNSHVWDGSIRIVAACSI